MFLPIGNSFGSCPMARQNNETCKTIFEIIRIHTEDPIIYAHFIFLHCDTKIVFFRNILYKPEVLARQIGKLKSPNVFSFG